MRSLSAESQVSGESEHSPSLPSTFNSLQNLGSLEYLNNVKIQTSIKKKGKSTALPEEVKNIFLKVKTYYQFKNEIVPSLFRKDGIRKKIKTHFFKWIKKLSDEKIIEVPGDDEKSKFKKLNQDTISNINLEFNSVLFKKTVFEVYYEDCKENKKLIQILLKNNKEILHFLNTPLYLLYKDYLVSKEFKKDFKKIAKKIKNLKEEAKCEEDKKIISLYLEIYQVFTKNFENYFIETSPNHRSSSTNRMRNSESEPEESFDLTNEEISSNCESESFNN
jgi:hypothetical protein